MITLYSFGPAWGMPDPSPFCLKTEMLLKIAGLDYSTDQSGFRKAPKGKQPYIDDDGELIADSTFIRLHIEKKYGFDFDATLTAEQAGQAWAIDKMCEDHLYWVLLNERWGDLENFERGPRMFFDEVPAPIRPLIRKMVRGNVIKATKAHGLGRHSKAEIYQLAARGIDAVAKTLGDKPCLMGDKICGADATVFAFIEALACRQFVTPVIGMIDQHENLVSYCTRMREEWFPDFSS